MAISLSTGAKIQLLDNGWPYFEQCAALVFAGTPPTNPDNGTNATLIARAGVDPDNWVAGSATIEGIPWLAADADGIIKADFTDPIIAKGLADGTARFFWIVPNVAGADALTASTTIARVQGIAAVGSGDLRLSNAVFSSGSTSTLDLADITFP